MFKQDKNLISNRFEKCRNKKTRIKKARNSIYSIKKNANQKRARNKKCQILIFEDEFQFGEKIKIKNIQIKFYSAFWVVKGFTFFFQFFSKIQF